MKKTFIFIIVILSGFLLVFGLSRFLETNKTESPAEIAEADLAFKAQTLKKISLGFDGLVADYYWMNALQYIGNKIVNSQSDLQLDDLRSLNPRLLYPMLDTITTLDPDFTPAYSYGSTILPAIDVEKAILISEKGIAAQPDNWRMYHNLGYIYWKNNQFKKAAEVYAAGATKSGAPSWLQQMSANMEAQGGSRDLARQMYRQMLDNAQDDQSKELAASRLLQIDSYDERDAIRVKLQNFRAENNCCAANWRELFTDLKTSKLPNNKSLRFNQTGEPIDPSNAVYLLVNQNSECNVDLDWKTSKIPYK